MNVWTAKTVGEGQKIGSWTKTNDDTHSGSWSHLSIRTQSSFDPHRTAVLRWPPTEARGYLKLVKYNINDRNQQWVIEN